jgi:hypothetical protein
MARVRKLGISIAAVVAIALLAAGCQPFNFTPGGGSAGSGSCLPGTWNLDTETFGALTTALPGLSITAAGPGLTLSMTATTWAVHADQTLTGSLSTKVGTASGSVHVTGDASGTYTSTASTVAFTLSSLSGSAAYDVTAFGVHLTGTLSLPTSGLQKLYGLTGSADVSCSASALSLTFPSFSMHAHH